MYANGNYLSEREEAKAGPMALLTVSIDDGVFQKINHWIQKAPGEVSGLGKIVKQGNLLRVIDACLIKQQNSAAETELDPASVAKAMYDLRNTPGALNFWWHSHVNMDVFWSGTDIDTIREIGRHGFVVSTVLNKRREMLSALYVKEAEFIPEVFVNQLPTVVQAYLDTNAVKAWDAEYDAKCTSRYLRSEWDWQKGGDYSGTGMGVGAGETGSPFQGKHENEGYRKPNSDDAPTETVSTRSTELDPSDTTNHFQLLQDEYLCEEIIEDWGEDMDHEINHKSAENILALIVKAIAKLEAAKEIPAQEALALKEEYIDRFNQSRADFRDIAMSH